MRGLWPLCPVSLALFGPLGATGWPLHETVARLDGQLVCSSRLLCFILLLPGLSMASFPFIKAALMILARSIPIICLHSLASLKAKDLICRRWPSQTQWPCPHQSGRWVCTSGCFWQFGWKIYIQPGIYARQINKESCKSITVSYQILTCLALGANRPWTTLNNSSGQDYANAVEREGKKGFSLQHQ